MQVVYRSAILLCAILVTFASILDGFSIGATVYVITDASYYRCRDGKSIAHPRYPWDDFDCIKSRTDKNATASTNIMIFPYIIATIIGARITVTCIASLACLPGLYLMTTLTLTSFQYYTVIAIMIMTLISPLATSCIVFPLAASICACKEMHYHTNSPPEYGSWL